MMTISNCKIENFTVFESANIEFCAGVNVMIGANGTGKSHLLKLIYAMTQWMMSLPFLLSTIAFGGLRTAAGKTAEPAIPLILGIEMSESMLHALLQLADTVRRENDKLQEYVTRRKVRDAIEKARLRWKCFRQNPIFNSEGADQSLRAYGFPPAAQGWRSPFKP